MNKLTTFQLPIRRDAPNAARDTDNFSIPIGELVVTSNSLGHISVNDSANPGVDISVDFSWTGASGSEKTIKDEFTVAPSGKTSRNLGDVVLTAYLRDGPPDR